MGKKSIYSGKFSSRVSSDTRMGGKKLPALVVLFALSMALAAWIQGMNGSGSSFKWPSGAAEDDIAVEKMTDISDDFIRGVDVSELTSLENAGVTYYDFNGRKQDVLKTLAQSGVNYVRIRVWNDPYDKNKNGYGGGNCDLDNAIAIGKRASKYGMKVLIDFHYSDFWADPTRQLAPKAWAHLTKEDKADALYDFTYESVKKLLDEGVNVTMVQVGNETNYGMAGATDTEVVHNLMKRGCEAVRKVSKEKNRDIRIALHYTNATNFDEIDGHLKSLKKDGVDYDIIGLSYYMYWHGTKEQLADTIKNVRENYGKDVMIAEFAYPYTSKDGDAQGNNVEGGELVPGYTSSVQSQSCVIRDMSQLAWDSGALGTFYWGALWIPFPGASATDKTANMKVWDETGCGWASSYSAKYDPENVGDWYGGSSWDNQALFDYSGHPLESLKTYKYLKYGATAPLKVDYVPGIEITVVPGNKLELPDTLPAVYNDRNHSGEAAVTWDESAAAIDTGRDGEYTITATVTDESDEASDVTGSEIECTVCVNAINYVVNPSFEDTDRSMWEVKYDGENDPTDFQDKADDASDGTVSFHFWDEKDMSFSISQKIEGLENGTYKLSVMSQGGDISAQSSLELYAVTGKGEYSKAFADNGWANWQNPCVEGIEVTDGCAQIGVRMHVNAKGWGTIDEFKLVRE